MTIWAGDKHPGTHMRPQSRRTRVGTNMMPCRHTSTDPESVSALVIACVEVLGDQRRRYSLCRF